MQLEEHALMDILNFRYAAPGRERSISFYQKYDHMGASSKEGIPGLIEEVVRYSAAMSEYTRVCNEEEEAESQNLDEEWER